MELLEQPPLVVLLQPELLQRAQLALLLELQRVPLAVLPAQVQEKQPEPSPQLVSRMHHLHLMVMLPHLRLLLSPEAIPVPQLVLPEI